MAQAAMRHSSIDLTMNVYTDPKLLDVQGALEALPALSLEGENQSVVRATGTDPGDALAPVLAATPGVSGKPVSTAGTAGSAVSQRRGLVTDAATLLTVSGNESMSVAGDGCQSESEEWAMRDSNPRHPRCKHGALTN